MKQTQSSCLQEVYVGASTNDCFISIRCRDSHLCLNGVFHFVHPGVTMNKSSGNRPHLYELWTQGCDDIGSGALKVSQINSGGKHLIGHSGYLIIIPFLKILCSYHKIIFLGKFIAY